MTANAGEIRARLVLSNDEFKRKMNEAREDMKRTGFSAQQMKKDFDVVQKGAGIMGGAILAAVGASIKAAANLEQNMANIRSVTGATDEEMKRLEKTAREWAANTKYDADQTSSALFELSKAGFSVNEQIDALPAVLAGATAGNISLADSANIVANTMRTFKIPAEEVSTAIDILAKTANSANTDIPGIAEGLKYVGPVAQSVGWTLEETAASLGILADHGIDASQAGTVLRASLLALANPTGQTSKAMKDLNIEVLDADGNMKSLPDLMGHISQRMEGMTAAQKTQTAAQLVGTQAAAGFIALLETGEKDLASYVKELENSAGAAQRMAAIQSDTLNGAFEEFKSVVQEAGIKLGQEFLPEFKNLVRYGSDVVRMMSDVDMSTVKTGITFTGTASAIAFTGATVGKLVLATSGLFASMGPAGWLIIGASLLGGAIVALNTKMTENNKINLENVDTLAEQANSLERNVAEFDKLSEKSALTTREFGKLLDIQQKLKGTQNPAEIAELQAEYERLAKKSGLSNEELDKMIGLNSTIIEQSPAVEQSFTDQGTAIIESTDAAKAYAQSLRDIALIELEAERIKALEKEAKLRQENKDIIEEISEVDSKMNELIELRNMPLEEVDTRLDEINRKMNTGLLTQEEYLELEREQGLLLQLQNDNLVGALDALQNQRQELIKKQKLNEEEIAKLDVINTRYAELLLAELGINFEKGKGLDKLDEAINRLQKEREELIKNTSSAEKGTAEYKKQIKQLDDSIDKHINIRDQIKEETGYQSEKNKKLDDANRKIHGQHQLLETTNQKIKTGTREAEKQNKELGRDTTKKVTVNDEGTAKKIHDLAEKPATKRVSIIEQVKSGYRLERHHIGGIAGKGTDYVPKLHTGGTAASLLTNRLENLPMHNEIDARLLKNEMVLTEGQQANLFRMIEGGRSTSNNAAQSMGGDEVVRLLRMISQGIHDGRNISIVMDERVVGRILEKPITEIQNQKRYANSLFQRRR